MYVDCVLLMKKFVAEYTKEASEQIKELDNKNRNKILAAIGTFELIGTEYKNIRKLDDNLYEIKPKGVRAYFQYYGNKIIIIGFITLKKTQKAPKRYVKQALENIRNYIKEIENEKNHKR